MKNKEKMSELEKRIDHLMETISFDKDSIFANIAVSLNNEIFDHELKKILFTYKEFTVLMAGLTHVELTSNENEKELWKELRNYLSMVYFDTCFLDNNTPITLEITDYIAFLTRRILRFYRDIACDGGDLFETITTIVGKIRYELF